MQKSKSAFFLASCATQIYDRLHMQHSKSFATFKKNVLKIVLLINTFTDFC